nr:glycosyltransferase family 39 protein [Lysinibacter cavernae]
MLTTVDAVHGLYYAFLHVWTDLFGASPFSVRFPSAIAIGVATSGVAVLASRLTRGSVGIVAAIIFMVLPRVTYMGMEARAYAFTMALVVWLFIWFIALVSRQERKALPWVGFAALFALTNVLFIYTTMFVLVFGIIALTMKLDRGTVKRGVISLVAGAAVALPVVAVAFMEREQIAFLHSRVGFNVTNLFVSPFFVDKTLAAIGWGFIVISLVAGITVIIRLRKGLPVNEQLASLFQPTGERMPRLLVVAATWLFLPSILLAIGNAATPLYSPRYLSFLAPAVAMLIALGIVSVARTVKASWLVPVLTIAVVVAASSPYLKQRTPYSRNNGTDWNAIAQTIDEHAQAGDGIIFDTTVRNSRKPRLAMHMYPEPFDGLIDVGLKTPYDQTDGLWDKAYNLDDMAPKLEGLSTVWLVMVKPSYSDNPDRQETYFNTLEAAGFVVEDTLTNHKSTVYKMIRGQ